MMAKRKSKKQQKSTLWITLTVSVAVILAVGGFVYYDKHRAVDESYTHTISVSVDGPGYSSLSELKKDSPYIFTGTVGDHKTIGNPLIGTEDGPAPGQAPPKTEYTINVDRVFKGKIDSDKITLSQLGGVADGTRFKVNGYTDLEKSKAYVFFVKEAGGLYGAKASGYAIFELVGKDHFKVNKNSGIEIDTPVSLDELR